MGSAAENPLASAQLLRCHNCAAPARGEVSWCLQCYAPLQPAPSPKTVVQTGPAIKPQPTSQSALGPKPRRPGRHSAEPAPLDPAAARELADQMIAQFAATPIPAKNWVDRLTASKSAGLYWAGLGLAIVAGICLILGTVIGLVWD